MQHFVHSILSKRLLSKTIQNHVFLRELQPLQSPTDPVKGRWDPGAVEENSLKTSMVRLSKTMGKPWENHGKMEFDGKKNLW